MRRRQGATRAVVWAQVCALAVVTLLGPVGCKPSAPAGDGAASVPESGAEAGAVLESVARYLPASTFVVGSLDLSLLGQGYSVFFTQALGMTSAEYAAMLKEVNDFILARVGWTVTDVKWALLAVGAGKEIILLVKADAQIQRGLEPIPGTDGLKGLRIEDAVVVPLAEQGLYAVLIDKAAVKWFSERKETLDSAEGKARLATLSGLLRRGNAKSLFAAAVSLDGEAKPIKKLRKDLPPPLQKLKGASITLGDALSVNLHGDNADLQAVNKLIEGLVQMAQAELDAERAQIDKKDTAEGVFLIAASHLLQPGVRALTPKIEGDYASIRLDSTTSDATGALMGVWIIGVMAAVAVPSFLNYTKDSKSSEAKINLKSIGDGAMMYAMRGQFDPATGQVSAGKFPITQGRVCTSTGGSMDEAMTPEAQDFERGPWSDMYFSIRRPHYFRYCYESSSDGQRFSATATTDEVKYELTGLMQGGQPVVGAVEEVY